MKLRFKKATVFALVLLLCLGTAGGLWWVWRHSYGYYVTRADEMFEQGRYSRAYALYQAAVWRGSEDDAQIPLLLRMAECVTHYRARTLEQAAENAGKGMHLLEYAAKLNPGNGDVVERYLTNVYQVARTTSLQAFWLRLHERAAALAGSVPPSDVAAKFAAIAQIQLAFQRQEDPDSDDVVEAREVLSDWYDEHPGDVDACFHLGLAELYQALHYRRSGNSEAAVHTARNARGYIRSFVAKHPESFPGKILSAELAVWCRRVGFSEPSLGELHEVVGRCAMDIRDEDDVVAKNQVASLWIELAKVASEENKELAEETAMAADMLARSVLDRHAPCIPALVVLADSLSIRGLHEEAVKLTRDVRDSEAPPVGIAAVRRDLVLQLRAARHLLLMTLKRLAEVHSPAEYAVRMEEAHSARRRFLTLQRLAGLQVTDSSLYASQLAFYEGHYRVALEGLLAHVERGKGDQPTSHLYCGYTLLALGERRASATWFSKTLNHPRAGPRVQWKAAEALIKLLIEVGNTKEALALAKSVQRLAINESDAEVFLIEAQLAHRQRRRDRDGQEQAREVWRGALANLKPLAESGSVQAQRVLAYMYRDTGQLAAAQGLLMRRWEQCPHEYEALLDLIAIDTRLGQPETALQRLHGLTERPYSERARQALADELRGGVSLTPVLLQLAELILEKDPVARNLGLARYYRENGQPAVARRFMVTIRERWPGDERLLAVDMDLYIARKEWELAVARLAEAEERGIRAAAIHFWRGKLELARGHTYSALKELEKSIEKHPYDASVLTALAGVYSELGFHSKAEDAYKRALERRPTYPQALLGLHRVLDQAGRYEEALAVFQSFVSRRAASGSIVSDFLDYAAEHGSLKSVVVLREKIAQLQPEQEENRRILAQLYLRQGAVAKAERVLRELVADGREQTANVAALALLMRQTDGPEAGVDVFRDYLKRKGGLATRRDHLAHARYLRTVGHVEAAVAAYDDARQSAGDDWQGVAREQAAWLARLGRTHRAAAVYGELWNDGRDPDVGVSLANALFDNERYAGAQQIVDVLREKNTDPLVLGILEARIAGAWGKVEESQRLFEKIIRQFPEDPRPVFARARTFFDSGDPDTQKRVELDLRRSLELNPNLNRARELLATWYRMRGEPARALTQLRVLADRNPGNRSYLIGFFRFLMDSGQESEAEEYLTQASAKQPGQAVWHQMIGELRIRQGRLKEAVAELLTVLRKDPNLPALVMAVETLTRMGEYRYALNLVDYFGHLAPKASVLNVLRGRALQGLQRYSEAMEAFRLAVIYVQPDDEYRQNVFRHLREALRTEDVLTLVARAAGQRYSPESWLLLGDCLLRKGAYADAANTLAMLYAHLDEESPVKSRAGQKLAALFLKSGDSERARDIYGDLLDKHPDDESLLNNMSWLLAVHLDRPEDALRMIQKALSSSSVEDEQQAYLDTLGIIHLKLGHVYPAIHALKRSLDTRETVHAHTHLVLAYLDDHNMTLAQQHMDRAFAFGVQKKQPEALERHLQEMQKAGMNVTQSQMETVADLYMQTDKFPLAWQVLEAIRKEYGYSLSTQMIVVRYHEAVGNQREAEELIRGMIRDGIGEGDIGDWLQVARLCRMCGMPDEAMAAYEKARASGLQTEEGLIAQCELAGMCFDRGDRERAADLYRDCVAEDISSETALRFLDTLLALGRLDEAAAAAARFVETCDFNPRLVGKQADIAMRRGKLDDAIGILQFGLAKVPDNAELMVRHAEVHLSTDPLDLKRVAEEGLRHALAVDPHNVRSRELLVQLCRRQVRKKEGIAVLESMLRDEPLAVQFLATLGDLCLEVGDTERLEDWLATYAPLLRESAAYQRLQADFFEHVGQYDEALHVRAKMWQNERDANDLYAYARLLVMDDQKQHALKLLDAESDQFAMCPKIRALKASLEARMGNWADAIDVMSQNCGQLTSMDEESLRIVIGTCREGFGTKGMARLVRRLAESDQVNCAEFLLMRTVEEIPESEDRLALLEQLEFTDGQSRLKGRVSQLVGEIKTSLGEFRQASEHLRRARELQPADPRVWNSLANLTLDSQGDPLKAREYAKKAVALSEDAEARVRGACLMTLGRVLQRMGLTYPARTNFARSVAVYETAENRLHLGSILLAREVRDPNAAVELKRAETLAVLANKEDVLQEVRRLLASMDSAGSEGGKEAAAGDSMPQ